MGRRFLPAPPQLTRAEFGAWLLARDADRTVGVTNSPGSCPLAKFLELRGVGDYVDVRYNKIEIRHRVNGEYPPETPRRMPRWARLFARRIDRLGNSIPVNQATALKVLRSIPADKSEATP